MRHGDAAGIARPAACCRRRRRDPREAGDRDDVGRVAVVRQRAGRVAAAATTSSRRSAEVAPGSHSIRARRARVTHPAHDLAEARRRNDDRPTVRAQDSARRRPCQGIPVGDAREVEGARPAPVAMVRPARINDVAGRRRRRQSCAGRRTEGRHRQTVRPMSAAGSSVPTSVSARTGRRAAGGWPTPSHASTPCRVPAFEQCRVSAHRAGVRRPAGVHERCCRPRRQAPLGPRRGRCARSLADLKRIERDAGRQARARWDCARSTSTLVYGRQRIDVDRPADARLIDADLDQAKATKRLEVPHRHLRERLFVLPRSPMSRRVWCRRAGPRRSRPGVAWSPRRARGKRQRRRLGCASARWSPAGDLPRGASAVRASAAHVLERAVQRHGASRMRSGRAHRRRRRRPRARATARAHRGPDRQLRASRGRLAGR